MRRRTKITDDNGTSHFTTLFWYPMVLRIYLETGTHQECETREHMYLHRRQFVLGPRSFSPVPDWITTYVPHAGYLHHCPELSVASAEDADGQVWYLLGLAI